MAPSGIIEARVVTNSSEEEVMYLDKFTANCTEKEIINRFSNWTFDPVDLSDSLTCVSIASCPFSLSDDPLPVIEGGGGGFRPFKDYLGSQSEAYEPVEFGGKILAYCKEPGYVFDPANLTVGGELVVRVVGECVPEQVEDNLPAWLWAPVDPKTDKEELPHKARGAVIPGCGE